MDSLKERINVIQNLVDEKEFLAKRINQGIEKLYKEGVPVETLVQLDRYAVIRILQDKKCMTLAEAMAYTNKLLKQE